MQGNIDLPQRRFCDDDLTDPLNERPIGSDVDLQAGFIAYVKHFANIRVHERFAHDMKIKVIRISFYFSDNFCEK